MMPATAPVYTKTDVIVKVDHVCLQYGDKVILRDVDAEIRDIVRPDCVTGQVICFLGPSGIGKTQLSRIMTGLQAPTSGQVTVQGQAVHKGMVGLVPQNYPVFEFATVFENLMIAGKQAGLSDPVCRQKMAQLVEDVGLPPVCMGMFPSRLSGGQRQRVAIIRQLMCSEHFIVMDEPFSGLDPISKRKTCELITRVANRDELNTIIVVTHDVTEGCSIADTVWLMGREPGLPGARLVDQYDLAAQDLCWRPDLVTDARFLAFVAEIKSRFQSLG